MMKQTYQMITGVLLLCTGLYSCSNDTTEAPGENALEMELKLENDGSFQVASATYVFKSSGETVKFVDENKVFEFKFDNEQIFTAQKSGEKHVGESLLITNSVTRETINLQHFEELKNGALKFDVELSTGEKFRSVIYTPGTGSSNSQRWHDEPAPGLTKNVLKATLQLSQQDLSSSCTTALENCTRTGGNASVVLNNQHGWFTTPASCRVVCNG